MRTPQTFTTGDGYTYRLLIDIPTAREIRDKTGVDLLDNDGLRRACESLIDLAQVLYHAVREQCGEFGVTERDFANSLESCFDEASEAFQVAYVDFCRAVGKVAQAQLCEQLMRVQRESERRTLQAIEGDTAERLAEKLLDREDTKRRKLINEILTDGPG